VDHPPAFAFLFPDYKNTQSYKTELPTITYKLTFKLTHYPHLIIIASYNRFDDDNGSDHCGESSTDQVTQCPP
jgi:hypothetical protein